MSCGICKKEGHNRRTCPENSKEKTSGGGDVEIITKAIKITKPEVNLIKNSTRTYSTSAASSKTTHEQINLVIKSSKVIQQDVLDLNEACSKAKQVSNSRKSEANKEKCTSSPKKSQTITTTVPTSESPKATQSKTKKPGIHWLNPDALKRLNEGPTELDGPGYVYIYKIKGDKDDTENSFKIGLSKDLPQRRVHVQEQRNKQQYEIVESKETPFRYLTETTVHRQLHAFNTPKSEGDGRTEWFTGKKDDFVSTVRKVVREVNALYL